MRKKLQWGDLSRGQQTLIVAAAAVELVVTTAALRDLRRRDARGVRGSKVLWALSFVVQPVGPLAYFALGRATADR